MKDVLLLLTGCVNVRYRAAQTADYRKDQYVGAICFYYYNTPYKVVFVDNSGFDISNFLPVDIRNSSRFENLFYQNDNKVDQGKGYDEALIIEYAICNSKLILNNSVVVKITGRHIVSNIVRLIDTSVINEQTVCADYQISRKNLLSYFFIAPCCFFVDYFLPNKKCINDSEGRWFEYVLLDSVKQWKNDNYKHYFFKIPIKLIGTEGPTNEKYPPISFVNYVNKFIKYWLYRLGLYRI